MEELQQDLRNVEQQVSRNFVKEIKLDEVSTMHEVGPIVYDWIKIGQDGKRYEMFSNLDSSPGFYWM